MVVTCRCGAEFDARNPRAKFCSDRCRKRAQRAPEASADVVELSDRQADGDSTAGPIETAAVRELIEADRLDTSLGWLVVALARRLDAGGGETGSSYSALADRFETKMQAATRGSQARTAPGQLQDELAKRRQERGA